MIIVINNQEVVLNFKQTMDTLLKLSNIQNFIESIFKHFEKNSLYTNIEEFKSLSKKADNIEHDLLSCLHYGKLLVDELSSIETSYTQEFVDSFKLEINEHHLIRGGGFVLKYLGVDNKYCNSVSNISLYRISGELYDLWESGFNRKLSIPISHGKSREGRRIVGYNKQDGWGSSIPIYDKEGWY